MRTSSNVAPNLGSVELGQGGTIVGRVHDTPSEKRGHVMSGRGRLYEVDWKNRLSPLGIAGQNALYCMPARVYGKPLLNQFLLIGVLDERGAGEASCMGKEKKGKKRRKRRRGSKRRRR